MSNITQKRNQRRKYNLHVTCLL